MSRRNVLDKYYFDHPVNRKYIKRIIKENPEAEVFIEPTSGKGDLSDLLYELIGPGQRCIAIDIEPEGHNIIKCDFFIFPWKDHNLPIRNKTVIVLSPPFGRKNWLVYKFFNDCAKRSDTIYLICSRVFKKPHTHKELDENFHLEYSIDLPEDAFTVNGKRHKIRCCIQKWVRKDVKREIKLRYKSKYFEFTKREQQHDFAIGRVNISAGEVLSSSLIYKHGKNVLHIRLNPKYKHLLGYIKDNIDLSEQANNTISVAAKSVTRYEVIEEIEKIIKRRK